MDTIFARIIKGELPCYKVAENDHFLAFLDIFPLQRGHVLVIPKQSVDYFFDIEDDILSEMTVFAKQVSQKIKKTFQCERVGVAVIGFEVPHAHIHLIPCNSTEDMDFTRPKLSLSQVELADIAERLAKA
ncbi:MAG: HIT family protein [Bacteroidetes bacterium]|nr:MAG: HIT family protein [Bacteroidota bacterium]